MAGTILLNAVTVDTIGAAVKPPAPGTSLKNQNIFSFYVFATDFGGGIVTIEVSPDATNWFTIRTAGQDSQLAFSQSDYMEGRVRALLIRAVLEGATNPTALTAVMY